MTGMETVALGVERPRLIGDIVLDKIKDLIIDRQLAPGAKLSEARLAGMLNVSKTPVREALMRLRMIGLVTADEGSLRVVMPGPALVCEAYEVRAGMESMTAELSARRAPESTIAAIRSAADASFASAKSDDMDTFRQQDRQFHELIAAGSANSIAQQQVMNAQVLCQALRQRDVMTDQVSRHCGEAHLAITDAITNRDGASAKAQMAEHVYYVMNRVLQRLHQSTHGAH